MKKSLCFYALAIDIRVKNAIKNLKMKDGVP